MVGPTPGISERPVQAVDRQPVIGNIIDERLLVALVGGSPRDVSPAPKSSRPSPGVGSGSHADDDIDLLSRHVVCGVDVGYGVARQCFGKGAALQGLDGRTGASEGYEVSVAVVIVVDHHRPVNGGGGRIQR